MEAAHLPSGDLAALYRVGNYQFLPTEARGERSALAERLVAQHRVADAVNEWAPQVVAEPEYVSMLAVAGCHRDRLLLAAMHDCGLRVGEALGLWRGDMHLTEGVSADCPVEGAHLHVRRRRNCNDAVSKSRNPRWVPATGEVVRWYGLYLRERDAVGAARRQRLLFVNLSRRAGLPMRYRNAHEMVVRAAANAGVGRTVTPHTLRHCYGTALRAGGADRDVIAMLMGHRSHSSADVYIHPSPGQLRVAVADMVAVRKLARS